MRKTDLIAAPLGEGLLIFIAGMAGWLTPQPFVFASLGPTAYELIEMPQRRSARPYSVFVGHSLGLLAGYAALFLTNAWKAPAVSQNGVPFLRIWAAVVAAVLTVLTTLALRASQPAATSTTLLVATGIMQTPRDAMIILCAVGLMIATGEPLRIWRLRTQDGANGKQEQPN
jgi:hypothetical protein